MEAMLGRRMLGEIEEMSLEEVLGDLRAIIDESQGLNANIANNNNNNNNVASTSTTTIPLHPTLNKRLKPTHVTALDEVAARHAAATHSPNLTVAGRSLPLVYAVVATLVSPPHCKAVLVVDLEGRFDPTRLSCSREDLRHVYVQRGPKKTAPEDVKTLVAEAGNWMLYGRATAAAAATHAGTPQTAARGGRPKPDALSASPPAAVPPHHHHHDSAGRQWWGTIVLGSSHGGAGDLTSSWRGWLRVERTPVSAFAAGSSAQDAITRRDARQEVVDAAGWTASSPWGGFVFHEDEDDTRVKATTK